MEKETSEARMVRLMVRVLLGYAGEWVTFQRLSHLIAIPGYDGDFLAGFAEYRFDLFVIAKDKRLKLQPGVVEEVAQQGIERWEIPARPQPTRGRSRGTGSLISSQIHSGPCYGQSQHSKILDHLRTGSIPDRVLACNYCWGEICRVRGLFFSFVDPETWEEICRRRGYILQRQNPRGF